MKLLHLDSSALGANSISRELSAAVVEQQRRLHPEVDVSYRDLDRDPIPHLTAQTLAQTDPAEAAAAEAVMQQFLQADVIVIGAPMYNFAIPSTLKAWIDRIAVAGRTFQYTANGPKAWPAASASSLPARVVACMPIPRTIFRSRICARYWASWASTTSASCAQKAWRIRRSIAPMRWPRRWPGCLKKRLLLARKRAA